MKKYIAFLLGLLIILSLFSCESNKDQDDLLLDNNSGS